jgi:hypothetical protein
MIAYRRALVAVPLAVALAFGSAAALSGCSVRGIVQSVSHGHVDLDTKSVPADFPKSVPLANGDVVYGASIGSTEGRLWNVTIKVGGNESIDAIARRFTDAGFRSDIDHRTASGGGTVSFTKGAYSALVVVTRSGPKGWVANYTVTQKR